MISLLGVVNILRNQPREQVFFKMLTVDYVIKFFHFCPLELYQFDNFNLTLILAAGSGTAKYQTIFRLSTAHELLILKFV